MNIVILFFNAFVCLSCISNSANKKIENFENDVIAIPSDEDYKIINSTFVHLSNPVPIGVEREFGYHNFINKNNDLPVEFITKVYFTQHLVGLNDSLSFRNKLYLSQNSIDKLNDIEFKNLSLQLISNKSKSIKLDISLILNVGLNKLIGVDVNQKINTEIGESIISYSRIIYDDKKEKACFFFKINAMVYVVLGYLCL